MTEQISNIYDLPKKSATVERHIYLTATFEHPQDYVQVCQSLLELNEEDEAVIHICSGGGSTSVSDIITNAMSKCGCNVTCVLESNADSAASVVFLKGDSWEVSPNATMYIHNGAFGAYGEKASDTVPDAMFTQDNHFKMIANAYEGFLSEEEIEGLLKGNNIRLGAEAIFDRLENLVEYRQSLMQEMYLEEEGAQPHEDGQLSGDDDLLECELLDKSNDLCGFVTGFKGNPLSITLLDYEGKGSVIKLPLNEDILSTVCTNYFLKDVCNLYLNLESGTGSKKSCINSILNVCTSIINTAKLS